jgi:hypothetical protein
MDFGRVFEAERFFTKPVLVERFWNVRNSPEITQTKTEVQIFARPRNAISSHACPRFAPNHYGWVIYSWPLLEESLSDSGMLGQWAESGDNAVSNKEINSRAKHDHITMTA